MKAVVKTQKGPGHVELKDVPIPEYGETEVLIKVKAVGICGSDVHILHDESPYNDPLILGHEFSGEIVEVGSQVKSFKIGDRVVAENIKHGCGVCELCHTGHQCICSGRDAKGTTSDGVMTEYVVIDEKNLFHLPEHISFEEAALLEPVTVCCHALFEQNDIKPGDVALVMGPGTIGIISALLAKISGAEVILAGTSQDKERLELAKKMGIPHTVQVDKENLKDVVDRLTDGQGVDVAIECSGAAKAIDDVLWRVKYRGKVTLIGVPAKEALIHFGIFVLKEIELKGTLSHTHYAWKHAIKVLSDGLLDVKPLITHEYPLDEWEKGFEAMDNKEGIKVLLKP